MLKINLKIFSEGIDTQLVCYLNKYTYIAGFVLLPGQ